MNDGNYNRTTTDNFPFNNFLLQQPLKIVQDSPVFNKNNKTKNVGNGRNSNSVAILNSKKDTTNREFTNKSIGSGFDFRPMKAGVIGPPPN